MTPSIGSRARIPSINRTGTITYIDWPRIFVDAAYAIQVELDEGYREGRVWRTNTKDIEIIEGEAN